MHTRSLLTAAALLLLSTAASAEEATIDAIDDALTAPDAGGAEVEAWSEELAFDDSEGFFEETEAIAHEDTDSYSDLEATAEPEPEMCTCSMPAIAEDPRGSGTLSDPYTTRTVSGDLVTTEERWSQPIPGGTESNVRVREQQWVVYDMTSADCRCELVDRYRWEEKNERVETAIAFGGWSLSDKTTYKEYEHSEENPEGCVPIWSWEWQRYQNVEYDAPGRLVRDSDWISESYDSETYSTSAFVSGYADARQPGLLQFDEEGNRGYYWDVEEFDGSFNGVKSQAFRSESYEGRQ